MSGRNGWRCREQFRSLLGHNESVFCSSKDCIGASYLAGEDGRHQTEKQGKRRWWAGDLAVRPRPFIQLRRVWWTHDVAGTPALASSSSAATSASNPSASRRGARALYGSCDGGGIAIGRHFNDREFPARAFLLVLYVITRKMPESPQQLPAPHYAQPELRLCPNFPS